MDIDFEKCGGLVPAIIQDATTRKVLMLGYMNQESLKKTTDTGLVTFYSRSRQELWTKGETSGNYLKLVDIKVDCDNDTLLIQAKPEGPVCHTGSDTCWGDTNEASPLTFLTQLQDFIEKRHEEMPEGVEAVFVFENGDIKTTDGSGFEKEADMLYHLIVLLTSKGLRIEDLARELQVRHDPNWKKH